MLILTQAGLLILFILVLRGIEYLEHDFDWTQWGRHGAKRTGKYPQLGIDEDGQPWKLQTNGTWEPMAAILPWQAVEDFPTPESDISLRNWKEQVKRRGTPSLKFWPVKLPTAGAATTQTDN